MNTVTKMSHQMKLSASRCITRINLKRRVNNLQTIPKYSINILKLLRIYNFYKVVQFRMNLRKHMQQRTTLRRKQMDEPTKIVSKDGYKFILLDGLYYKLTKKSYSKEEIEQWCVGRKNASSKMKIYHKEKKIEREKTEKDQIVKTNAIYNREISTYPEDLRELFA